MHFSRFLATVFLALASIVCLVCALPVDVELSGNQPDDALEDRANVLKKGTIVTSSFTEGSFGSVCTTGQKALARQAVRKFMQFPGVVKYLGLHKPIYTWPKNNCRWGKDPIGNIAVYFDVTLNIRGNVDDAKWGCTAKEPCLGEAIVTLDPKDAKKMNPNAGIRGSLRNKAGKMLMGVLNNHVG